MTKVSNQKDYLYEAISKVNTIVKIIGTGQVAIEGEGVELC